MNLLSTKLIFPIVIVKRSLMLGLFLICTALGTFTTNTANAQGTVPLNQLKISFVQIASGFTLPVAMANANDGSGRLFVVEKVGRVRIVKDGSVLNTPFLDITPLVDSAPNERGLLGLAFHPKYKDNGYFYVYYTAQDGDITIARYTVTSDINVADPNSAKIIFTNPHPRINHNGGQLQFGPDGFLYAGLGDGGGANDPDNNGQKTDVLLGKLLRFDVDNGDPYGIPADNPFASNGKGRPEIWAYGLRNPWRFSFDRETGDLYIADVGQDRYEEFNFQPADSKGGTNYGWDWMEGKTCFYPEHQDCRAADYALPIFVYDHGTGISITGGYVYRGKQFPDLNGVYFFGDFGSAIIWGSKRGDDGNWQTEQLSQAPGALSTFGEDEAGEIYITNYNEGAIYHLVEATQ